MAGGGGGGRADQALTMDPRGVKRSRPRRPRAQATRRGAGARRDGDGRPSRAAEWMKVRRTGGDARPTPQNQRDFPPAIGWTILRGRCIARCVFFPCRSPTDSRIRAKTIYAVSRNQFRHELDGVHFEIQATDPDDMDLEVLRGRANRT
uniref:ADF-H domain-containing protein n=1 Tax=Setaria italica TaxID=4555 RepID=K4AI48_SETIT